MEQEAGGLGGQVALVRGGSSGDEAQELPATLPLAQRTMCATCQQAGTRVAGQTVQALLAVSLRAIHAAEYRFCHTATCPVVYFAVDGTQHFTIDQVRERVYHKEPAAADVLICYCFRHTVGAVQAVSAPGPARARPPCC